MNYSLGNMLSGGGVLNADGLALDLAFALDNTLTARKGPTPTFTRASTATFVGSNGLIQSASNDVARFDYNPATLASKGLLIEESRTNGLQRSDDFTQAIWSKINVTASSNTLTSPDGSVNADTIAETTANGVHRVQYSTAQAAGTYAWSIYAKSVGGRSINLELSVGGNGAYAYFDLANKTVLSSGVYGAGFALVGTPLILNAGNGWFRLILAATVPINAVFWCGASNGTSNSYVGDVTKGMQLWGAQLEVGSFATSYIPTTTAALTRSADVCSISGASFSGFYNQSEGTISVAANGPASGSRTIAGIDDNTSSEMIRLRTEGTDPFYRVADGGAEVVALDLGSVTANTNFKIAAAYATNDFAASLNGGAVSTDSVGTLPTVDRIRIGAGQAGNTFTGTISRISYYRKRLANSKLQTLST